jgi:two-component system nitrogen regulation response regulator GlnG
MKGTDGRPRKVLIVDDEKDIRELLAYLIKKEGWEPALVPSGASALESLRHGFPDDVLLDLSMPDLDGMAVLKEARKIDAATPIIVVTGHGSIGSAVAAVKQGAYDYVTKPFQNDELILKIWRALENHRLQQENDCLRTQINRELQLQQLMGSSDQIRKVYADVERVAPTDFTVIIGGETGSGKELVARAIHRRSRRGSAPFVPVDCGAIQPNLIESELFGHEKGSFTGADRTRPGKFEAASGGTLFLDEIQNLPLPVQTKLLRALQEKQICHVGGMTPIDIDFRVVAATNQDLETLVAQGHFRQDLYHRLHEFGIRLPPLRERRDDMLFLVKRFIDLTCEELRKEVPGITGAAVELLLAHKWPGNVRELRNVIRRAVLLAEGPIDTEHLGLGGAASEVRSLAREIEVNGSVPFKELVRRSVMHAEREILHRVLKQTRGNKAKAARLLQIDYKTIRTKAKQYGLLKNHFGGDGESQDRVGKDGKLPTISSLA